MGGEKANLHLLVPIAQERTKTLCFRIHYVLPVLFGATFRGQLYDRVVMTILTRLGGYGGENLHRIIANYSITKYMMVEWEGVYCFRVV